jgi:hypothetical protein
MKWLLITLLIVSCGGVRKTQLSKIDIKVDSISVSNDRLLKQNIRFNRIVSLKPLDSLKPIRINGKDYFNASIVFDESIINDFEVSAKEKTLTLDKSTATKKKVGEREDNTILYLGICLIIVMGILVWLKY